MTLKEIAGKINGKVIGDEHHDILYPAKIEEAGNENITFYANEKYLPFLQATKAGAIVISKNDFEKTAKNNHSNWIVVEDAYAAFTKVLELYNTSSSVVDQPQYKIGKDTVVYPNVFIGDKVTIGDNCIIYPNVVIYKECVIGNNCIIHSGAVIGSDGFGFAPQKDGSYQKIPQLGNVVIEDDCEIGASTCIDRATMGSTIIRKGVKLDNLIQVAHNVEIGEHTVIAAQTGISGSTKIGHHNMIGGQVGFVGHIVVAPYTKINAQSAVAQHVKKEGLVLSGAPAIDMKQHFKSIVIYKNLPELEKKVRDLETQLNNLKNNM
jgi:UDP-3-O-[3-hydroxymyristoyl] glucosamine N-acyltransferase